MCCSAVRCSALQCVAVCCSVLQCAAVLLSRAFAFSSPFLSSSLNAAGHLKMKIQGAMKRGRPETSFVSCWHSASSEVRMSTLTIEPPLACVCVCVCMRERERERVCVCVRLCVCVCKSV